MLIHTYRTRQTTNIFLEREEELKLKELEGKLLFLEDKKILPCSLIMEQIDRPIFEEHYNKQVIRLPKELINKLQEELENEESNGLTIKYYESILEKTKICLIYPERLRKIGDDYHYLDLYELVKDEINSKSSFL